MDYIRSFDIQLAKDVYYAGETLAGHVVLENSENIKIRGTTVVVTHGLTGHMCYNVATY